MPNLLDFNDWLNEKTDEHGLMKKSATRQNLKIKALQEPEQPQKFLHKIHNKRRQRSKCHHLPQTLILAALYAKVTTVMAVSSFQGKDSNKES